MEESNTIQAKNTKIYYDYASFKGNTFEENVKSINSLLFGQGIKISDSPFIYLDEKDKKNYLSATQCSIEASSNSHIFYFPRNFLYVVLYFDDLLFFLDKQSRLNVFKFEENCYKKYIIDKFSQKESKVKCNTVKEIEILLEKTQKNVNLNNTYEILCDVLENKLNEKMEIKEPKNINGEIKYNITIEKKSYKCTIKTIRIEVDSIGLIREKLLLSKGEISFEDGINKLSEYLKDKKKGEDKYINNIFKCPIIYKNFEEEEIPENQTLVTEIKSGFDIFSVKKQLEERIDIIKNCLFNKDERPNYFLGVLNVDTKDADRLKELLSSEKFILKEKTLIITAVDFMYCNTDLSYKINNEYILYKKIEESRKEMNEKIEETRKEMKEEIEESRKEMNDKFDILINTLKSYAPFITIDFNKKNGLKKEK